MHYYCHRDCRQQVLLIHDYHLAAASISERAHPNEGLQGEPRFVVRDGLRMHVVHMSCMFVSATCHGHGHGHGHGHSHGHGHGKFTCQRPQLQGLRTKIGDVTCLNEEPWFISDLEGFWVHVARGKYPKHVCDRQ